MKQTLTTIALSPLLLAQGIATRRNTPVLPEPPGARKGTTGNGPALRLLVLGDSAAAGVGAPHQDRALLGQLVSKLSAQRRVEWQLLARTGHKTADTLARLETIDAGPFDVAVTSLGVNDVVGLVGRRRWRAQQACLRELLRNKFSVSRIVISGLPPIHGFPARPQPLRRHVGARATQFDSDLRADVSKEPDCRFVSLRFTENVTLMAADGFHPGPEIYSEWARRVANQILDGANDDENLQPA